MTKTTHVRIQQLYGKTIMEEDIYRQHNLGCTKQIQFPD